MLNRLKPVTYNVDVQAVNNFLHIEDSTTGIAKLAAVKALEEKEKINYTGFIAQDVETAAQKIGYDFSGIDNPKSDADYYGLRYGDFVVPLVKAVQQQQQQIKDQQKEIEELKQALIEMQEKLKQVK